MAVRLPKKLSPRVTEVIRADHTKVTALYHRYHADLPSAARQALVTPICALLEMHAAAEEEVFYPAMRSQPDDVQAINNSLHEHNEMKLLISRLRQLDPMDADFDPTLQRLMRAVLHHVAEEETVQLPMAEARFTDEALRDMGARFLARKMQQMKPLQRARSVVQEHPALSTTVAAMAGLLLLAAARQRPRWR
jgi:hemerythrin superfamily protein